MKLKGLANVREQLKKLQEQLDNKIDNIEWDGKHNKTDQQKDEMFNEAHDFLAEALDALHEIRELQLEDF